MIDNPGQIINQLEATCLLAGTWILKDIDKVTSSMFYCEEDTQYTYSAYYKTLLGDVDDMPTIQLQAVVTPGTSRAYLIDLTTGLECVMDSIEVITNKVLFFRSKVKGSKTNLTNLNNSFKAWYLIAMQRELQRFELKLPAKALDSLAESEFARLVEDAGSELEALDEALGLLVDRLKSRKRLAQDKYKLGQDQANMSLLPQLGSQAGYSESQSGGGLLKDKYGLGMELPERGSLVLDEPDPSLLKKNRKKSTFMEEPEDEPFFMGDPGPEVTVVRGASKLLASIDVAADFDHEAHHAKLGKIQETIATRSMTPKQIVLSEEVDPSKLVVFQYEIAEPVPTERFDGIDECHIQPGMKALQEAEDQAFLKLLRDEVDKSVLVDPEMSICSDTWNRENIEDLRGPEALTELQEEAALLQEARECGLEIHAPLNENPVSLIEATSDEDLVVVKKSAPAQARRKVFVNEEVKEEQPFPAPAVSEEPVMPTVSSVKKRRIVFED